MSYTLHFHHFSSNVLNVLLFCISAYTIVRWCVILGLGCTTISVALASVHACYKRVKRLLSFFIIGLALGGGKYVQHPFCSIRY